MKIFILSFFHRRSDSAGSFSILSIAQHDWTVIDTDWQILSFGHNFTGNWILLTVFNRVNPRAQLDWKRWKLPICRFITGDFEFLVSNMTYNHTVPLLFFFLLYFNKSVADSIAKKVIFLDPWWNPPSKTIMAILCVSKIIYVQNTF